jgi:hypothetical protein
MTGTGHHRHRPHRARPRRRLSRGWAAALLVLAAMGGCSRTGTATPAANGAATSTVTATGAPSATSAPASPTPGVSSAPGRPTPTSLPCGPFSHPLDPLDDGPGGSPGTGGVEGHGCGPGQTPPFTVASPGWTFSFAYTCTGSFGGDGMRDSLLITAHNTVSGVDLSPVHLIGPWAHGGSVATEGGTAPAGHYLLRVTLAHPEANQCQWHLAIRPATP